MDFFEVINTRKTIRDYKNEQPPLEDIKKIINAARLAPSATNTQNWEFIVISNKQIMSEMADAAGSKFDFFGSFAKNEDEKNQLTRYKTFSTFFSKAPVVIAVVEKHKEASFGDFLGLTGLSEDEISQMRPDSSLLSIGAAIENISLAAHALGYGTCWMCAPIVAYKELKEMLNIAPEDKLISLIPLGKPNNPDYDSRVPKKNLGEVMRVVE